MCIREFTHEPYVRSTLPPESRSTSARSDTSFAPPAYVVGIRAHCPSSEELSELVVRGEQLSFYWLATSSSSIPRHSPSTSAAWIKNSLQADVRHHHLWQVAALTYNSRKVCRASLSNNYSKVSHRPVLISPWQTSTSVISCHLFIATNHLVSILRQLSSYQ